MTPQFEYTYHHLTNEFCAALPLNLDNAQTQNSGALVWQRSCFSTLLVPPTVALKQAAIFENNVWQVVPDHRGETWFTSSGGSVSIDWLGDPVTFGLFATLPAKITGSAGPLVHVYDEHGVYVHDVNEPLDAPATQNTGIVTWQIVPSSTSIAPPTLAAKQAAVFADGAWSVVPDHRGETWFDAKAMPVKVAAVGEPANLGLFAVAPVQPRQISLFQFNMAVHQIGIEFNVDATSIINAIVAAASIPVQIAFKSNTPFHEDNPVLSVLTTHFNKSVNAQIPAGAAQCAYTVKTFFDLAVTFSLLNLA